MLYYLSQSYKIKIQNTKYVQIQNTKYVHARLPTILIQERHSKVNGIPAKRPFLYVYMWHGVSKNIWYPTKPRDTFLWHGVSKKIPRNLATRFCGMGFLRIYDIPRNLATRFCGMGFLRKYRETSRHVFSAEFEDASGYIQVSSSSKLYWFFRL